MREFGDFVAAGEEPRDLPVGLDRFPDGRQQVAREDAFPDLDVDLFILVERQQHPPVLLFEPQVAGFEMALQTGQVPRQFARVCTGRHRLSDPRHQMLKRGECSRVLHGDHGWLDALRQKPRQVAQQGCVYFATTVQRPLGYRRSWS
jgi:hypothetical protein